MSYKRFISYIYSYEKGIKSKNSGFARVEVRDNLCKINISLRIDNVLISDTEDNSVGIYLYQQEKDKIKKILIGRVKIEKSASSFRGEFAANNIMNSGISVDHVSGIFICADSFIDRRSMIALVYASEWKDTQIDISLFNKKHESQQDIQNVESSGEIRVAEKDSDISELNKILDEQEQENGEESTVSEQRADDVEQTVPETQNNSNEQEPDEGEGKPREPEIADYYVMLSNCYPKVDIQGLNGECIRITPHDITYLPRKFWHLCNNSFLLHSYYNYRYIFLLRENEGEKYAILVPGVNNKKEMAMARIYGFQKFSGENDDNKIGYWYMYI